MIQRYVWSTSCIGNERGSTMSMMTNEQNPFNWPNRRKYITVWVAVFTTALTALNCTSIAVLAAGGAPEHYGVSRQEYTLAVTMLVFAIANTPLVLAPISEVVS